MKNKQNYFFSRLPIIFFPCNEKIQEMRAIRSVRLCRSDRRRIRIKREKNAKIIQTAWLKARQRNKAVKYIQYAYIEKKYVLI